MRPAPEFVCRVIRQCARCGHLAEFHRGGQGACDKPLRLAPHTVWCECPGFIPRTEIVMKIAAKEHL